jgi:hypothetical protein
VQEILPEQARTIIARNSSPDVPFSQSVNPYRGCEHGCIYCYARPSHAYIDLSPGLDFERRLRFKANAAEVLERELASRVTSASHHACNTIPISRWRPGSASRSACGGCDLRAAVSIITKSALAARHDIGTHAARGLCHVVSARRGRSAAARAAHGLDAGAAARARAERACRSVLWRTVIPVINDAELEAILPRAQPQARAKPPDPAAVGVRELFREGRNAITPERAGM